EGEHFPMRARQLFPIWEPNLHRSEITQLYRRPTPLPVQRWRPKLNNFDRTLRQGLHERSAIGLGHDPIVQDHNDTAIGFSSDKTADALSQFQNRFRERILSERVTAAFLNEFQLRFDQRSVRHREWQARATYVRTR